jgi:Tol biopolymer transport system component
VDEGVTRRFIATKLSIPGGEAIRWTSSGDLFFIGDVHGFRSVWRIGADAKTHRIVDGPHQVTTSLEASNFSLSPDAARLVFTASPLAARLWSYGLDDAGRLREGSATAITPEAVHVVGPDLSRDGKRLVFALSRPGSRFRRELVAREVSTGAERTWLVLDDDRRIVLFPRWSRRGNRLSYTLLRRLSPTTAEQQVRVFDPALNQERALTSLSSSNTLEVGTNWTPDDQFIVSSSERYKAGQSAIVLLQVSDAPAAEKTARVLTTTAEGFVVQASMSPDSRWVVFRAAGITGTRTARLAVVSTSGGQRSEWIVLTNDDFNVDKPRWSQNGDAIYFTSDNGGLVNLWRIGFDTEKGLASGPPEQLTRFTGPAAQLLPDIRALEVGVGDGRIVLPLVHQKGSVWVSERLSPSK